MKTSHSRGIDAQEMAPDPPAGADDRHRAEGAGRAKGQSHRLIGADEVEHRLGALAMGEPVQRVGHRGIGENRFGHAELAGKLEAVGGHVDDDHPGRRHQAQILDGIAPEPAGADHDGGGAREPAWGRPS